MACGHDVFEKGLRCLRTMGEVVAMVAGVMESKEETEETGEDVGDQALVSKNQQTESSIREKDSGAVVDCSVLTLWWRCLNRSEGLVTGFRPRKRAKYSQRRIVCLICRLHLAACVVFPC